METVQPCKKCGATPETGPYPTPLCTKCRDELSRRRVPAWIKSAAVIVLSVLIFAFSRFPSSLGAGVAFERGRRAEALGKYSTAVNEYQIVVNRFPNSILALARLGIAEFDAGQYRASATTLGKLGGSETTPELAQEVNQVIEKLHKMSGGK